MSQLGLWSSPQDNEQTPPRVSLATGSASLQPLADALPKNVYLGTSSWSFPGWAGIVYDKRYSESALARDGLKAYASHPLFRTVGIDRTHYALETASLYTSFADVTPPEFRFLAKAYEGVTLPSYPLHPRYGKLRGQRNPTFLDAAYAVDFVVEPFRAGLGAKAGPLLFQFPPHDVGMHGGPHAFAARLHKFLEVLPKGGLYAVEVRNAELLTPDYAQALASVDAVHCFNALRGMPSVIEQARLLKTARFSTLVLRWMLHDAMTYAEAEKDFAPFDRLAMPDDDTRHHIAQLIAKALMTKRDAFVIVNNKAEGCSPLSVIALARHLMATLEPLERSSVDMS